MTPADSRNNASVGEFLHDQAFERLERFCIFKIRQNFGNCGSALSFGSENQDPGRDPGFNYCA